MRPWSFLTSRLNPDSLPIKPHQDVKAKSLPAEKSETPWFVGDKVFATSAPGGWDEQPEPQPQPVGQPYIIQPDDAAYQVFGRALVLNRRDSPLQEPEPGPEDSVSSILRGVHEDEVVELVAMIKELREQAMGDAELTAELRGQAEDNARAIGILRIENERLMKELSAAASEARVAAAAATAAAAAAATATAATAAATAVISPPTHSPPTHGPPLHSPAPALHSPLTLSPPSHSPPTHSPPSHRPPTHSLPPHSPPPQSPPPQSPARAAHSPPTPSSPSHSPPTHSPSSHCPPTHSPPPHSPAPASHSPPTPSPPSHSPATHSPATPSPSTPSPPSPSKKGKGKNPPKQDPPVSIPSSPSPRTTNTNPPSFTAVPQPTPSSPNLTLFETYDRMIDLLKTKPRADIHLNDYPWPMFPEAAGSFPQRITLRSEVNKEKVYAFVRAYVSAYGPGRRKERGEAMTKAWKSIADRSADGILRGTAARAFTYMDMATRSL